MRILVFDTETTGLVNFARPEVDPLHPRLVQIAGVVIDGAGSTLDQLSAIITPRDFEIPEKAVEVHGITTEIARAAGVDCGYALTSFLTMAGEPDLVVAHNVRFDMAVLMSELARHELSLEIGSCERFCTMQQARRMLGMSKPNLMNVHLQLFGENFMMAHDAMADTRACARIYVELAKRLTGTRQREDA